MAIPVTASTNATTKITQLYVAMFGRAPDIDGLNFWGGAVDGGQSVAKIAQDMFATTPARAYFPAESTSQQIIQAFYVNVLGRQPDAEGLAFWVARLDALKGIGNPNAVGQVVTEIISIVVNYQGNTPEGAESARLFANKIEVANFWVTENGSAVNAPLPISLVTSDPASVNQVKVQILSGFGNITFTLKESMVDGSSGVLQPIRLTSDTNNGGTIEKGYTTAGDDLIVAGRLELLHQAYIDGGQGRNVLEIDAKGVYAQPAALINIQEVRVENLANVYTTTGNGASGYLNNSSYPQLASSLAAASEVISASAFNKLVVTANQLKITVNGQTHAVSAGVYTAESLAEAINSAAGAVVAVVNPTGISLDGATMTFRGNAATQIPAAQFNSVVINDLQLQVVNGGVEVAPSVVPAGVYTAAQLAAAINTVVGANVAVVDAAASAAAGLVATATAARADFTAAQLSLDAAEARAEAADALADYTTARAAEVTSQTVVTAANAAVESAETNLELANAAVAAANAQAVAQSAANSANASVVSTTGRTATANTSANAKVGTASNNLAAAQTEVADAKAALDAVVAEISSQINGVSADLLNSANAAVTQAQTSVTQAQNTLNVQSGLLAALLAPGAGSTAAQIQASQNALAQSQQALAQANTDLTTAMQARTEAAMTIANGLVQANVDHLSLPVLQNEYAQAQGAATQAGVALVAAQAAQAATLEAGAAAVAAATAAQSAANAALAVAVANAAAALDDVVGIATTAAGLLAEAQADAITVNAQLTVAMANAATATAAVDAAFTALGVAQAAADAANQAAARELAQAGSTDTEITAALAHTVTQAQAAVITAQTDLAAAETALANATAGNLFGGSGSVSITTNATSAQEIRFYGDQSVAFGLSDIAQDGTLTIPARLSNSVIDLSRAADLDRLVITESAGAQVATAGGLSVGALTVLGVRNGATLRLEGSFTQNVNVEYSAGMSSTVPLKLELVLGDVADTAKLNLVHNTSALHIDSLGGGANRLDSVDFGQGTLSKLIVSGNAGLYIAGDLGSSFSDDVAIIDASANTVGVSLTLSGTRTVEAIGTVGNDYFNISAGSGSSDESSVVIQDTTGNNTYIVNSEDVTITSGNGNNLFIVTAGDEANITTGDGTNRVTVNSTGDATVMAGQGNATVAVTSGNDAQVTLGSGKHLVSVNAEEGRAQVTIGTGDSRVAIDAGESYLTTGNGNNRVVVTAQAGHAEVTAGDGNSQYVVEATGGHVHVTAGNGNNKFELGADQGVNLVTGNGASQISVTDTAGDVTIVAGNGDSNVLAATVDNITVTVGNGNSHFDLTSEEGSVALAVGTGNQTVDIAAAGTATLTTGSGNHNVTIDAATIVVNGGETGNGIYDLSEALNARADSVTLTLGAGNNQAFIDAQVANVTAGNGNNLLNAEAMVFHAIVGNGSNGLTLATVNANITLGDGNNKVDLRAFDSPESFWTREDDLNTEVRIHAGNGANTINLFVQDLTNGGFDDSLFDGNGGDFYLQPALIEIVAGNGGNTINIPDYPRSSTSGALTTISITTGSGNDAIVVGGSSITVHSGGGNDNITIVGIDNDYTSGNNGALLNIDTGTGSATINLGAYTDAAFLLTGTITAKAGSTITGSDITLVVNTYADLRAVNIATVNGESVITRVILDDDNASYAGGAIDGAASPAASNATLVLTDKQFLAIGAENFSVDGAIFDTHARIKIIVTETTSLTALGVGNLTGNIDLQFEINDGVTLTMTAQQLHEHVAAEGITLGQKDRSDKPAGKVVITGAGTITDPVTGIKTTFDPFNTSDTPRGGYDGNVYVGGSLSSDFLKPNAPSTGPYVAANYYNVSVVSGFNGYVRPYDVEARQYILVDTDNVEDRLITSDQDTDLSDLYIRGGSDFTLAKGVELNLGENFIIDFSTLQGEVINLTIADFQDVKQIRGNSREGFDATVQIMLRGNSNGDGGTVGAAGDLNGLNSSGVNRYIVVDIADNDASVTDTDEVATIYLCDRTRDLETIGLRGNFNATLNVMQAMPGLDIELQGDGFATRTVQPKADGPFGYSNIGTINVSYTVPQTEPVLVIVNNQGVATNRPIHVEGVHVGYATSLTFTITDGNVIFDSISGNSIGGTTVDDDMLEVLDFNTANNVTIVDALSLDKINTIDASDVQGSFKAELKGGADATDTIDFISSTGPATLILDSVVADKASSFTSTAASDLTVVIKSTVDLSNADTSGIDAVTLTNDSTLALTFSQLQAIGTAEINMAAVDTTGTLDVTGWNGGVINTGALGDGVVVDLTMAKGTWTLAAGSDFSALGALTIGADTTVTLTADQLAAIVAGLASPAPADLSSVFTLNERATLNITGLTQAHLDATYEIGNATDGYQTFSLIDLLERLSADNQSGSVGTITLAESVNLSAGSGAALDFAFVLGAGMTLGLATAAQADGLQVTGGAGSTIEIQFLDINGQPGRDVLGAGNSLDASGYDVDKLRIPEVLIGTGNVDWMFSGLSERVVKSIYQLGWVDGVSQTVEIEAGTTVPGWLVVNITNPEVEVRDLTINLLGGAKLDGNLRLTTTQKLDDAGNPLFHTLLKTLTINSTGTAANALTEQTANIIDGNIAPTTAQGGGGAGYTAVENNLLTVIIAASQDLVITGSVLFNSRVDQNLLIPNDEQAVARLTVTGTANVTIGNLNTVDTDVDSLVVNNNGMGVLTIGLNASTMNATDALSFTGTGDIVLRITGAVDLSNDNLAAVSAIELLGTGVVTLTADQVEALGAANITLAAGTAAGTATLEVIGLDSTGTFDSTLVGNGVNIHVTTADGDVVLNAGANLTDITQLTVGAGDSLTLTADQALTLLVEGITPPTSIIFTGGGTINVTNAGQADFDAGLGVVLIAMNAGLDAGTLGITEDLTLTASIVNAAAVDGFALEGNAPGLRIDVIMDAANRMGDPTGAFAGDADLGLASGSDEQYNVVGIDKDEGVTSRNIATYVVTALDAVATDVFYVCNDTQGLTTLGLQGNSGDTIYFGGVKRSVSFLLEGDGQASWSDVEKRDNTPDQSNIGSLVAAFYTPNNPMAVVNINNQGVALTDGSVAGTERILMVDGITINNALGLTINVTDGDATIGLVNGNTVKTLNLVSVEDLFITAALPNLDTIDATAVTGLFKATISDNDFDLVTGVNADVTITGTTLASTASIDGTAGTLNLNIGTTSDLSAGTLISVETVKIASGVTLTLSAAQVAAIGEADITGVASGANETLNINGLNGAITINEALLGAGVVLGTVTMAAGSYTLTPGTDLTGASLVVPAGGTLTLTADQYMALADLDGIAPVAPATAAAVIHITGLTQAHIDAGFSLANVSNVNFALSDVALDPAATTVNLGAATNLNGFGVDLSANQTLGIANSVQADGLRIAGDSTNTVVFRFDALDTATTTGGTADSRIDASKYSIGTLRAMDAFFTDSSALNGEENAEFVIQGLAETVTLVVYTDPTLLSIPGYNRTVIIETGVTVPAEFVFNDTGSNRELIDLSITLQGDSVVNGDLRLPSALQAASGARFFDDLIITSTGAASAGGNRIVGSITPMPETGGNQNPTSTTERENNLLKVTIAGDKALTIVGDIVFNKVGDNNAATTPDNGAATLTVTSTAAVTVGALNTQDNDVTSLTVSNTGGGTLSVTIDASQIDPTDALTFTGSNIALTIAGGVNLSDDVLTAVSQITLVDATSTVLTLTQAQFDTLGAANLVAVNTNPAQVPTLNLVGFGSAPFDATTVDADINVGTITLVPGNVTLNPATNLTGVDAIIVADGGVLTLTAAQFQQLQGAGAINAANPAHTFTVNITGLTQADVDAGFNLSQIGTTGIETITVSLGEPTVNLGTFNPAGALVGGSAAVLNGADFVLAANQTLGLVNYAQANGLDVTGGANSTIIFKFTNIQPVGFPLYSQIDASGYDVTVLKALANSFTNAITPGSANVEYVIDGLPSAVELRLYEDPASLGFLDPTFRKVVIEAGVSTPVGLIFNDTDFTDEVRTLSLTLEGGSTLSGNLAIPTFIKAPGLVQRYFDTLTIHSEGATGNTIAGSIVPVTALALENNILKVVIDGSANLTIAGDIVFNKVGDNNAATTADNGAATLTVTSTAAVTVGALNTQDNDVTSLTVSNTGGGTLSVTIDASQIDPTDALTFTGSNIALTMVGAVDLSNDNLAGVDSIRISDNSTLTLSQAQFDAIGAAGLSTDGTPVSVNLVINAFGSAPFDATALATGINVQSIVMSQGDITLDPATNLTGVDQIVVPEGSTLRLTAAQFKQLQGTGTIVGFDQNGDSTIQPFNVFITDLTQADITSGSELLNLSLIGAQAVVNLALATSATTVEFGTIAGVVFTPAVLGNASITMTADGQMVGFVTAGSASGRTVNTAPGVDVDSTSVVFAFDDAGVAQATEVGGVSQNDGGVDAANYAVGSLRALNVFVDGRNIEQVVRNLAGSVDLVVYQSPEDLPIGFRTPVDRTVIILPTVTIEGPTTGGGDGFVAFIDLNNNREIRNLTIEMRGGTEIDGNVRLASLPDANGPTAAPNPMYFNTLTIVSTGTAANRTTGSTDNVIDGSITAQPVAGTGASQTGTVENNLLNVVVNGTQNLRVTGDIVFSKVGNNAVGGGDDATATLTINNTGTTTIEQLDVSDNDLSGLTIVNNGGLLTVTGASPALLDGNTSVWGGAGSNLETLTFSGTGNIVFGLNPNSVTETGLDLANVSTINASGLSGNLDLGEVTNIDSANFSFIAGTGVTKLTLTSDTLLETAPLTDTGWNFNFANAAAGSEFHLGSAAAGSLGFNNGGAGTAGALTINLGNNTTLYIDENTDLTDLDLTILQSGAAPAIVLADGVTLTLTAAQASMLRIVAGPDTGTAGITARVNVIGLGDTPVDLSGIAANIAGTTTLEDNDVTLAATTHLGSFSVTLNSLVDAGGLDLSGQTIRFATQVQADGRAIIVTGDADTSAGVNSTNVVWLFNTVTGPLDTSQYDGLIGRLWLTQTLLNGVNVEQLFTSLPTTIVRGEFSTITQLNGFLSPSQPVDRIVELVAFSNLPNGMVFNDTDALEGIRSLTLNLGGQVSTGDISIDDAVALGTDPASVLFNTLTINSYRALHQDHVLAPEAYVNNNDGINQPGEFVQPNNINTVGNIRVVGVANSGIDLLTVNLETLSVSTIGSGLSQYHGANLVVGTITFDSAAKSTPVVAALNVNGANNTTVASLDATDGDIDTLSITNSGSGNLVITGASPAASLGNAPAVSNVEALVINATSTGSVTLGTAGDPTKPGVVGDDLSLIDVNGGGNVNLGVIAMVDGNDFTLDTQGSSGAVTAVFDGMTLNAAGQWTIEGAWSGAGTLNITLVDTVNLGAGTLTIDDAVITIKGNVDFTTLLQLNIVDVNDVTFIVPAGNSLTILAEDADGLTVTGAGAVYVEALEATPAADLSAIMTNEGDTGTVFATVDTTDDADADLLPETVNLTGNLGIAQVTVLGGGLVDVTSAFMDATIDRDPTVGVNNQLVKATFVVQAATTLVVTAAQGDDRSVTGAGTTNVEDIGIYAGTNVMSLAGVVTSMVNIAVDTNVTLNSADNLGAAGVGRVTTLATGVVLTSAGSVVNGQHIAGENARLRVDDENTLPVETPITANLSNVTVESIILVPSAIAGMITFPVLYGSPAAFDLDPTVPFQTVTLTALQASGQTITGANAGADGQVIVNALGAGFTNLSLIDVGRATANVPADAALHASTNLGEFAVVLNGVDVDLTLSAAQANGRSITDTGADGDSVTITALELTPNADLSAVAVGVAGFPVFAEFAELDASGGVTLGANLGSNMEVKVTNDSGVSSVVSFAGNMVSNKTKFTIADDDITLAFDANNAHELTVVETGGGVANSVVIVNNVDGDLMDLSGITADTMIANVPVTATMDTGTDFGGFVVNLAEGANITMSYAQFQAVGAFNTLDGVDFTSAAGGVEELVTVTDWNPSNALDTSVVSNTLALILQVNAGLGVAQTVNAATNLSGVEEIFIPAGVTLTMTADQFQQIQHSVTVTGAGTLNLTNFDSDNASIDLSSVTAMAGTITLDPAAGLITNTVPELLVANPIVLNPAAVLDNASGAKFSIVMSAIGQAITLSSETQADGRVVEENGFAQTALVLGFTSADATDADPYMNATGFHVDNVYVLNQYLANEFTGVTPANIEQMLTDLDSSVVVTVYDVDTALVGGLVNAAAVESTTRVVNVESNTFVNAALAFNDLRPEVEVTELTINLHGNSVINGSLTLPQNTDPMSLLPTKYVELFQTLNINSDNNTGGVLGSPNRINGNIIANTALARPESTVEQFTLDLNGVAITGSQEAIGFAGVVVALSDLDNGILAAGRLATGINAAFGGAGQPGWYAQDNGNGTVTFTALAAGAVADVTLASFQFTQNSGATVLAAAVTPGDITIGQQGAFAMGENNLLEVNINATHALVVSGVVEFSYVSGSLKIDATNDLTAVATLNVSGNANVTMGSVNTNDVDVTGLIFNNTNTATILIPGTSPGAAVGNTETLVINNTGGGTITFGTAGDATKPGVAGADLSLLQVNGNGTVNLGVIALVDGQDFFLDATSSSGVVTATIAASLQTGGTWRLDNDGSGSLILTINEDASFAAGSTLLINGATITIDGDVDLSGVDLSGITNSCSFFVPQGSNLTLTVDQIAQLSVLGGIMVITGEGTVEVLGEVNTDVAAPLNMGFVQTVGVDLSGITNAGTVVPQVFPVAVTLGVAAKDDMGASAGYVFTGTAFNDTVTGTSFSDTFNVQGGTDTITGLTADGVENDVLVVSAGATANAANIESFIATAATVNNGTVNLSTSGLPGGGVIDVSLATGSSGFNLTGDFEGDVLIGSNQADVINGGNIAQANAAQVDVLTGNAGADVFVFNVQTSSPATGAFTSPKPAQGVDREVITITADVTDDVGVGEEGVVIAYTLNQTNAALVLDLAGVDVTSEEAIANAIAAALGNITGINASVVGAAGDFEVRAEGANGNKLNINSVSPTGTLDGLTFGRANGVDVAHKEVLTITGSSAAAGEIYTVTATLADGTVIKGSYVTLAAGETAATIAAGIANIGLTGFNVIAPASTVNAAPAAGVITFDDEVADDGAFTITFSAEGGIAGTGASDLAATYASADVITDFVTGTDNIGFGGDGDAGTLANYRESVGVSANYGSALATADLNFDGTVKYYFTWITATGGEALPGVIAAGDEVGLLFFDLNGDKSVDGVVRLVGVNSSEFTHTDIDA